MYLFSNPKWLDNYNFPYNKVEEVPETVFGQINDDLILLQSENPIVSIVISAFNEEINILRCIASLSKMKTTINLEIIVVDNNSKDHTSVTISKLAVRSLFEPVQGCGAARQLGQENAKGKYILLADADCFYPSCWVDIMIEKLQTPGVVCVYGRYSFMSEYGFPRWKLYALEKLKDAIAEIRHINRPYFNAFGISMGYIKELGLKVGFIKTTFWGDDGKLCLDLMQFGKIKQVRSSEARVWTSSRTLKRSGSFTQVLNVRIKKEAARFFGNFAKKVPNYNPNDPQFSKD